MGLGRNKDLKRLELRLEFLDFLKEYGIEPNDLHYLHEALEYVKNQKELYKKIQDVGVARPANIPDDKTKKKYEEEAKQKMTPEEFISMFAGESEEFYPYGKPKDNN